MSKRRRSALVVLALAAAAVFVLPASPASAVTNTNACTNNITANRSQIDVTTDGTDAPDPVAPAGTTTTSGMTQSLSVPGAIFVAGYNLGFLTVGENTIPATART